MNWLELSDSLIINLDLCAGFSRSGFGTTFYIKLGDGISEFDSDIPFETVKDIAKMRRIGKLNEESATNDTLKKILSSQTTQVP